MAGLYHTQAAGLTVEIGECSGEDAALALLERHFPVAGITNQIRHGKITEGTHLYLHIHATIKKPRIVTYGIIFSQHVHAGITKPGLHFIDEHTILLPGLHFLRKYETTSVIPGIIIDPQIIAGNDILIK